MFTTHMLLLHAFSHNFCAISSFYHPLAVNPPCCHRCHRWHRSKRRGCHHARVKSGQLCHTTATELPLGRGKPSFKFRAKKYFNTKFFHLQKNTYFQQLETDNNFCHFKNCQISIFYIMNVNKRVLS